MLAQGVTTRHEELLIEMMNQGFIIYKDGDKFTLQKLNTPVNSKISLFENGKTWVEHDTFEAALAHVKQCIGWEEKPAEPKKLPPILWDLELMYKHRGFPRPRFEKLGQTEGHYGDAVIAATASAEKWMNQTFQEDEIERWEVRVRPVRK